MVPPQPNLSIREAEPQDFESLVDYFLLADPDFLFLLGADINKLPDKKSWLDLLQYEYEQPVEHKKFYYLVWLVDGKTVGHSNINKIIFSEEAYMHLHLWKPDERQKVVG